MVPTVVHMDTPTYAELIGNLVATATKEAGHSEKYASELYGIPRVTYRRKLQGDSEFTMTELQRIADRLQLHDGAAAFIPRRGRAA